MFDSGTKAARMVVVREDNRIDHVHHVAQENKGCEYLTGKRITLSRHLFEIVHDSTYFLSKRDRVSYSLELNTAAADTIRATEYRKR